MSPACIHSVWQLPVVFSSPRANDAGRTGSVSQPPETLAIIYGQRITSVVGWCWGPYHFYLILSISCRFWMVLASPCRRKSWFPIHPRKMGIVRRGDRSAENEVRRTAGWIIVFCLKIMCSDRWGYDPVLNDAAIAAMWFWDSNHRWWQSDCKGNAGNAVQMMHRH